MGNRGSDQKCTACLRRQKTVSWKGQHDEKGWIQKGIICQLHQ